LPWEKTGREGGLVTATQDRLFKETLQANAHNLDIDVVAFAVAGIPATIPVRSAGALERANFLKQIATAVVMMLVIRRGRTAVLFRPTVSPALRWLRMPPQRGWAGR